MRIFKPSRNQGIHHKLCSLKKECFPVYRSAHRSYLHPRMPHHPPIFISAAENPVTPRYGNSSLKIEYEANPHNQRDLTHIKIIPPPAKVAKFDSRHSLFPEEIITLERAEQNEIPNCSLISVITSTLCLDPAYGNQWIRDMMFDDQHHNVVYVKIYTIELPPRRKMGFTRHMRQGHRYDIIKLNRIRDVSLENERIPMSLWFNILQQAYRIYAGEGVPAAVRRGRFICESSPVMLRLLPRTAVFKLHSEEAVRNWDVIIDQLRTPNLVMSGVLNLASNDPKIPLPPGLAFRHSHAICGTCADQGLVISKLHVGAKADCFTGRELRSLLSIPALAFSSITLALSRDNKHFKPFKSWYK